jgi:ribonuclease HII
MSAKKSLKNFPDFHFEMMYHDNGVLVAGIDEAGRGALAGPVVAAAVILKKDFKNDIGITDSKQVSAKRREQLYQIITKKALSIGIGIVDNSVIDKINILKATQEAMHKAIKNLKPQPGQLLIDGNYFKDCGLPYKTIVGGDSKCLSIAAASIIAKVTRDKWMIETAHPEYPDYGFLQHKGYGTKFHLSSIKTTGLCPLHRKTFLKKFLSEQEELF